MFELAAPAYNKEGGAIPHPGWRKISLQYDGRLDGRFEVQFGTWNLGILRGNGEKFVKN